MTESLRVLLTSCGGLVLPGMVKCLRDESAYRFHLVGVDMTRDAVGAHFVDAFHTVPPGLDPTYSEEVLAISEKEDVQVIVPLSDEEALALSEHKAKFAARGIVVATSGLESVRIASNKGKMLSFLDRKGIPTPAFRVAQTLTQLDQAVQELGYPERDIIIKPTVARGGRGFWVLSDKHEGSDLVFRQRERQTLPYPILRELLAGTETLPELVVMEYLTGADFNVDLLCEAGKMLYCIPIERLVPEAGPVQVGRIRHDPNIDRVCQRISAAFGFDHNINVEVAYRDSSNSGEPQIYEINPRVSAPIAMHRMAGINLLLLGILQALGREIPRDLAYREVTMLRCWQEVYE